MNSFWWVGGWFLLWGWFSKNTFWFASWVIRSSLEARIRVGSGKHFEAIEELGALHNPNLIPTTQ